MENLENEKDSYENLQDYVKTIELPAIDTVENMYPEKEYQLDIEFPEFTTLCPKTGFPDFAVIRITYSPGERLAELRSLKYYLTSYRSKGFFHEHFTNRILDDFANAVNPLWAKIEAEVNVRGGIYTTVRASYRC